MARTHTYDVTVADIGGTIYGFDHVTVKQGNMVETTDPFTDPPEYRAIGNDVAEGDGTGKQSRIVTFSVYTSGIEAFTNEESAPNDTYDGLEIVEIRIAHSGGTLTLNAATDWFGSAGEGFIYFWYPNTDLIWTAADIGLTYSVEIDTNANAPDPPDPGPEDNIIVNRKNPGGGVPIPNAEYTTTQTAQVTQSATQSPQGRAGGQGKGGGGGPPAEVIINLPDQAGTFDLTGNIEAYDYGSGTWYLILQGANITGGDTRQRLKVGSTITAIANAAANDVLPYLWRVRVVHGDATAVTYSVEYKL